jgi:lysophospholipase L1-like esterase
MPSPFLRPIASVLLGVGVLATASVLAAATPPTAERWEPKLSRYLDRDKASPPPTGAIVFAGSSSIEMWETMAADFPGVVTVNRGIGGTWLADLPKFAGRLVLPLRPRMLVVYAGENDLHAGQTVDSVVAAFDQVRDQFFAAEPNARLVFLALKPSPSRRAFLPQMRAANARIAAACGADRRCTFVDVFTPMLDAAGEPRGELFLADKLHMNAEGYRLWTKLVAPAVSGRK